MWFILLMSSVVGVYMLKDNMSNEIMKLDYDNPM